MTGWTELWRGPNAARSAVVGGGMVLHAVNVFIVATILPSIVADIGGLRWFAWSTTLYVVASLLGAVACARLLRAVGARWTYRLALLLFAIGCLGCATAPTMPALLVGRFVQGLGAGMLSALSFTQVRALFPEHLWTRALTVISVTWGAATLLGPAIGGVFAQYHAWRAAFWVLLAAVPVLAALVERALPRTAMPTRSRGVADAGMAWLNLALLSGAVLAVSVGSMASAAGWNGAGLLLALAMLAVFARRETTHTPRLLPRGATDPATPLGMTYGIMALLLIGLSTEIFVPLFLQTLHGLSPLHAGYLTALMSAGWTIGAMASTSAAGARVRTVLAGGPLLVAGGLAGLLVLVPQSIGTGDAGAAVTVVAIGACMLAMGLGIGICWPHLGTRVFSLAADGEQALAAASITTVVMVSNAFGSALGGMVTNLAGLSSPGGLGGIASAAAWLFGSATLVPLAAVFLVRRLTTAPAPRTA